MLSLPPIRSLAVHEVSVWRLPQWSIRAAWQKACSLWSIFGFSPPRVNRSIVESAAQRSSADAIAYLQFVEKKVTVNLHRLEQKGLLDELPAILAHELGHKFIPESLKNLLLINSAVRDVIEDEQGAHMVGNLFMDMVVNMEVHRRGEKGIHRVYAKFWESDPDKIQQIIGRAYEKIFQRADTSMRYAQTIIRRKPSPELEDAADKIAAIIMQARRSNWLTSAKEFAKILYEHADGVSAGKVYVISETGPDQFSPEGNSPIPPKGPADVDKLQKRLGGTVYDLRQLEDDNKTGKKPCSLGRFIRFLNENKINISYQEALIWYYRDLIGGKTIKVPEVTVASGSLYPVTPKTWQPGDPIHQLDIPVSKGISGVVIPGITTKKWVMKAGQHLSIGKDYPDLDLWFDSSGSMEDPTKTVSHAVAAGMIVAKSFLATKKSVRVVNFSAPDEKNSHPGYETTKGFTKDEYAVDQKLVAYIGGMTNLPIDEIEQAYKTEGKQKYIVMISDLGIQNLDDDLKQRLTKVFKQAVGGTIYLIQRGLESYDPATKAQIEANFKQTVKTLEAIGFDVVPIKNVADLDQQALKLTKKLFESRIQL